MVYTSISLPVLLDKGNMGNEVSGFREKKQLSPSCGSFCILPPACILPLVLQSAFYTESAFYPWSAVLSPQSLFYTDRMENLEGD